MTVVSLQFVNRSTSATTSLRLWSPTLVAYRLSTCMHSLLWASEGHPLWACATLPRVARPLAFSYAILAVGCGGASAEPTGRPRADAGLSDSAVVDQGAVDAATEPIEAGTPAYGALGDCMATEAGVCTTVMPPPGYECVLPAETSPRAMVRSLG